MIQVQGVSKQYGSKLLFENADGFIGPQSRVALIGPNGAGKSTLIRLILGQETPDTGRIVRSKHLTLGHLAQEVPKYQSGTVLSEVTKLEHWLEELKKERTQLENTFASGSEDVEALERYGEVLHKLERYEESRLEAKAKEILMGMGFKVSDFHRSLTEFSGGWLMRVAFSRVLLMEPDLLLLDEPTNHLDLESLLWLESFLRDYAGAILMISHDTAFLNALSTEILEIDQKKIFQYRGNLDSYALQKAERLELLKAQHRNQQVKIEHLESFINRFKAKASKAKQAQSRVKQLEKMERIELPEERATIRFRFPTATQSGKEVITLKDVAVNFGQKHVFGNVNWTLQRKSRVAIAGINGAGKTTLLRLLSGDLDPTSGEIKFGHQVQVGYYAQLQSEALDMKSTILEELEKVAPQLPVSQVRGIAGAFLFTGDAVEKKCSVLSGGEKARVAMAKLLLSPSNFLILDEPTNHLDVESREVLMEALQDYHGTVVLVSHDRDFMAPLVDSVLELQPYVSGKKGHPQLVQFLGSYEEYVQKKMKDIEALGEQTRSLSKSEAPATAAGAGSGELGASPSNSYENRKTADREKRSAERKRVVLEEEIQKLEELKMDLESKMTHEEVLHHPDKLIQLSKEHKNCEKSLGEKITEWERIYGESS